MFLIVLSDQGFTRLFRHADPSGYLAETLRRQGELIQNYYAVAGAPLANEIALISGQGPTPQTAATARVLATSGPAKKGQRGQVLGNGCVYPRATKTLADQLTAAHAQPGRPTSQVGSSSAPTDAPAEACKLGRAPLAGGAHASRT